jgi:predicted transcriptional regulator
MADLTITAANVVAGTGAILASGTAGETILAGQPLYLKSADGRLWKARCSGSTEESTAAGIALHGATAGQPIVYETDGVLNIGATTVKTSAYVLSATAGGICPMADLVSTNKVVFLGYATDLVGTFKIFKAVTGAVI